jgi:hypothetical protein
MIACAGGDSVSWGAAQSLRTGVERRKDARLWSALFQFFGLIRLVHRPDASPGAVHRSLKFVAPPYLVPTSTHTSAMSTSGVGTRPDESSIERKSSDLNKMTMRARILERAAIETLAFLRISLSHPPDYRFV